MAEKTKYLLVGGGLASVWAAQSIRAIDGEGRLIIVSDEARPPYDKPPLSKQYIAKDDVPEDDAYSKFDNFYPDNRIELMLDSRVVQLDRAARTVTLENREKVEYETLLLCTGASPKQLDIPGIDFANVFYLRKLDQSLAIRDAMKRSKRAVFVGAGYLNLEVASGALERGMDVTIIESTDRPWSRFASPALGRFMKDVFGKAGARFHFETDAGSFVGNGAVSALLTSRGDRLECDMAVVSVGASLNSAVAAEGGLKMGDRGGVMVDEFLRTSDENIYAAGDIACFKDIALGKTWHAEHHLNAKWQGRAAGTNMAAGPSGAARKPYDQVAYFFSDFLDLHMIQRGDPAVGKRDGTRIIGDMAGGDFVELYPDNHGVLRMGVAISHEEPKLDPASDRLEEDIRGGAIVADIPEDRYAL